MKPMLATKLTLPIAMVMSLVAGSVVAGRVLGTSKEQLDTTRAEVERLKDQRVQDALDLRELRTRVEDVAHGVERIERRMGTRP